MEKSPLCAGDLEKINAFATRELTAQEVYVFNVTLCDNDIDRDYERFSLTALRELAPMFIGKTVIADHSMKSADQRARIFDTAVERRPGTTADGEALYRLKGRAYMLRSKENQTLIDEIEAGIKKEGSVSCAMGVHRCSICGRDRRREGCEHINATMYGDKLCYTVLEEPQDAYEFSFVAVPAQRNAGVTKIFHSTGEETMEQILKSIEACGKDGMTLSKKQAEKLTQQVARLEEEATLARTYKAALAEEIGTLFKKRFPEVDGALIDSLTGVMTAKELAGFQQCLQKKEAAPAQPQLMPKTAEKAKRDFSSFKI